MCIFRGPSNPDPTPMPTPAPIMSRLPNMQQESRLPTKKDLVDEDEVTGVEYGSSRKEGGPAAGKKVGTKALRIPLNTGQTTASAGQGGLNV
tara:strand:+ start:217 stop:492 length:276 start_codon:yes stop_codon:yes gene_type:complete